VAERPAINASPLIFLSRAGLMDFLQLEGNQIVVPKPVAEEIQRRGSDDPTVQAIGANWGQRTFPLLAWKLNSLKTSGAVVRRSGGTVVPALAKIFRSSIRFDGVIKG
jgi:hypothetical protein